MPSQIDEMNAGRLPNSSKILERAKRTLVSPIVTGPLRTPKNIPFVREARGAHVFDVDGHDYVDITMAYGPLILGHCHPVVVEAIERASRIGTVYAMAHEHEVRLAELMVDAIPCADRVAFSSSGTEATLHAMRIARARTGRDKIAKFEGGYHGVHDYALVSGSLAQPAGTAEDPQSVPDTPGIPEGTVEQVVTLSYGHPASLEKIRAMAGELAAVIIEPVPSSYPVDLGDYLAQLRELTRECGVLLIFDEVISGFRLGYGGAQEHFGVTPDMATYGKVMGGGLPAGAVAGHLDAMRPAIGTGDLVQDVAEGKLLLIGTFSGNPMTSCAGAAVLEYLRDHPEVYPHIDGLASRIKSEVHEFCRDEHFDLRLIGLGSWFLPHFIESEPKSSRDLRDTADYLRGSALGEYMRYHGVYASDLHVSFVSFAHSDEDADRIVEAYKASLVDMRREGLI
ncbi:MAG: aspartate aminotransferase family protein [Deltaproteobacteria bacterium]|nr:aspartate aminotransferase family protein [Deltaproteobacteria bacterium]